MMDDKTPLLPLLRRFIERDPATAAHDLETMDDDEAMIVLQALPLSVASQIFLHFHATHAANYLKDASTELFDAVVRLLRPEEAASILIHLNAEKRMELLDRTPTVAKKQIQELLSYPENSAGRIMTTEFMAFSSTTKVKDAIQKIRSLANRNAPLTYTYVTGPDKRLVGVLNMRDLMLAAGEVMLESVMRTGIFSVNGFMDREEVANELSQRQYLAAPVVDNVGRLLGVVKSDQLIEDVQEEATEDIQKMVGAGGDERAFSPVVMSLQKRLPWLHVNLVTAFLAAAVVSLFEDLIAKISVLAVFLPIVAGQGGNAGAQSLAVVIRGLTIREIPPNKAARLVMKEGWIGLINGLVIGIVTALVAWWWNGNPFLGVVIGLAMIVNIVVAGIFGAAIPLMMKGMGQDPAQSSTIFLTTVTDIVGFFTFLGFAVLFQDHLV